MKTRLLVSILLLLTCGLLMARIQAASVSMERPLPNGQPSNDLDIGRNLAHSISMATGIAISPLLGIGCVGAFHGLWGGGRQQHWTDSQYIWGPCLLLALLFGLNSLLGTPFPALKKLMDSIELWESKGSGLGAAVMLIPQFGAPILESITNTARGVAPLTSGIPFATFLLQETTIITVGYILAIPALLIVFGVVWMAFHAINVLIMLSPWGLLDLALRGFRIVLMGLIALAVSVHSVAGAVLSAVIFLCALLVVGWAFRLTVFGAIFSWDLLTLKHKRTDARTASLWVFTARRWARVPIRTFGQIGKDATGRASLFYRPFLILRRRSVPLPVGSYAIVRGIVSPTIIQRDPSQPEYHSLLRLPPQYRSHERVVAARLGITDLRDNRLIKGTMAAIRWLKGMVGSSNVELAD